MPTAEEIEAAKTPAGGWTKKQLAEWGVPWPAPKGWKARLILESGGTYDVEAPFTLVSKYDNLCWFCGEPYQVGDLITAFGRQGGRWGHPDPCWVAWRKQDLGL